MRHRLLWESRWLKHDARRPWLEAGPRRQVRAARDAGWIAPGTSVIDLGCGVGHTAAWLASLGHRVAAVDISRVAIKRARRLYGDVRGLTFVRADLGRAAPWGEHYDVVLDLGCLHQLPPSARAGYAANVRGLTAVGSRLLYLVRTGNAASNEATAADVQRLLGSDFELERAQPTELQASHAAEVRPGLELRFIRAGSTPRRRA